MTVRWQQFGADVQHARTAKNWTMRDCAKNVGVNAMSVCRAESGKGVTADVMLKLCRKLLGRKNPLLYLK